jgi:hypothetical protein
MPKGKFAVGAIQKFTSRKAGLNFSVAHLAPFAMQMSADAIQKFTGRKAGLNFSVVLPYRL